MMLIAEEIGKLVKQWGEMQSWSIPLPLVMYLLLDGQPIEILTLHITVPVALCRKKGGPDLNTG